MRKLFLFLFCIVIFSSLTYADLTNAIKNCYAFEESSGTTAEDSVKGENGTIVNTPTLGQSCKINNCFRFDQGSNEYVLIENAINSTFSNNAFTITFWSNMDSGAAGGIPVEMSSGNSTNYIGVYRRDSDDMANLNIKNTGGTDGLASTDPPGTWSHFAIIIGDDGGVVNYLINNVSIDTSAVTGEYDLLFLTMGGSWYASTISSPFDGYVDEIKIWERELTRQEISDDFNNDVGVSCADVNPSPPPPVASLTINTDLSESLNYTSKPFIFNFNGTVTNTDDNNFNCSLYINQTLNESKSELLNLSLNQNFTLDYFFEGYYEFNISCFNNNASDSNVNNIFIDNVLPELEISTNFVNNSFFYTPLDIINYTITATDNFLFAVNHTLIRDGTLIQNDFLENLTITTALINYTQGTNNLQVGNYTINVTAWDSHTNNKVKPLNWFYRTNSIVIDSEIEISSDKLKPELTEFILSKDETKYKFKLTFEDIEHSHTFRIFTLGDLRFIQHSGYKGHFVYFPLKRWIDFEGDNIESVEIHNIGENYFEIKVNLIYASDEIELESIGDLNVNSKEWYFTVKDSISVLAVKFDVNDVIVDSATYVNVTTGQFNTTQERNFALLSSFNINKSTLPQTSVVTGRLLVDGNIIIEQELATVTGIGDIKSTGFFPTVFNVSQGEHIGVFQIKEDGQGAIGLSNVDLNLFRTDSNKGTEGNLTLQNTIQTFSNIEFTEIYNYVFDQTFRSNVFYILDGSISGTSATDSSYYFKDNENKSISPIASRSLSSGTDLGRFVLSYIDTDTNINDNMSIFANNTDGTVTINMSILSGSLLDDEHNLIQHGFSSNPETNLTNTIILNAGMHTLSNFTHVVYNGTSFFTSTWTSLISLSGEQTVTLYLNTSTQICSQKQRELNNNDVANVYFYGNCNNLVVNETTIVSLLIEINTGESVRIYDENIFGAELVPFSISRLNNPPQAFLSQDLSNVTEAQNSVFSCYGVDFDSTSLELTAKWFVNGAEVSSETQSASNFENITFILSQAFFSEDNLLNATCQASDLEDLSNIVSTSTITIGGTGALNTQSLLDINQTNSDMNKTTTQILQSSRNIEGGIMNIGYFIGIGVFIFAGILLKSYWLWSISGLLMTLVGAGFIELNRQAGSLYNTGMAIVFFTAGIMFLLASIIVSILVQINKANKSEEDKNQSGFYNAY